MIHILIPARQTVDKGQFMTVILNNTTIYLMAKEDTSSASYDESFNLEDFDRSIHGFRGINDDLQSLYNDLTK